VIKEIQEFKVSRDFKDPEAYRELLEILGLGVMMACRV
jgi:hypothetical protein